VLQEDFNMAPSPTSTQAQQGGFLGHILAWAAHPFQSEGSAWNWILFVGLLIVAAWFWQWSLLHITKDL
jgi:hypothetical protein